MSKKLTKNYPIYIKYFGLGFFFVNLIFWVLSNNTYCMEMSMLGLLIAWIGTLID